MGSFSSTPIVNTSDNQDEDLDFPTTAAEELLARCETELKDLPKHFNRNFKMKSVPLKTEGESKGILE